MRNKYGARKVTALDGEVFDSIKEFHRWNELKLLHSAGVISDLRRQVEYEIIPKQDGERACHYIADFVYINDKGETIVEDTKGFKTDVFRLKKKLMLWVHGIKVKET